MRALLSLLLAPAIASAQIAFPSGFPSDAVPFTSEALKQRLTGNVFLLKPVSGPEIRLQFRDADVFSNSGRNSNWGKWRIDGSSVCIDWQQGESYCNEARHVGDTVYWKRGNGEVAVLLFQ